MKDEARETVLKVVGVVEITATRIQELQDKLAGIPADGLPPTFVHPSCKRTGTGEPKLGYTYHKYPVLDAGGTFDVQVDGTAEALAADATGERRLSAAERTELTTLIAGAIDV